MRLPADTFRRLLKARYLLSSGEKKRKRLSKPTYPLAGFFGELRGRQQTKELRRKRRSREEIKRLVSEFEKSGLRSAKFCRSHGLALSILQRHLKSRRLENGQAKVWGGHNQATNNRLVAVELGQG